MCKAIFTFIATFVVGVIALVFGFEFLGGYPEFGAVAGIAVASGLIVYFQNNRN